MELAKYLPRDLTARIVKSWLNLKLVRQIYGLVRIIYRCSADLAAMAAVVRPQIRGLHLELQCVVIDFGDRPRRIAIRIGVLNEIWLAAN